jgi:hypothetical protein
VATHAHGLPFDDELPYEEEELRYEDDEPARATGWWELVALRVLVVAGAGLPVVGWLTGMAMVGQSHVWTRRDAWISAVAPLPAVLAMVVWSAIDSPGLLLHLGPLGVLVLFGGALAGLLGGAYLAVRALLLS